jgi:hypothetical protein
MLGMCAQAPEHEGGSATHGRVGCWVVLVDLCEEWEAIVEPLGAEVVCDSAANHSNPPLGCAVPFSRGVITRKRV